MTRTTTVNPYELSQPMLVQHEFFRDEPPQAASDVLVMAVSVAGVDLLPMLGNAQIERIRGAVYDLYAV